jgi:hypothetical protein
MRLRVSGAKAKGNAWERDVRNYLRDRGADVEALRQIGTTDEGDAVHRTKNGIRFIYEMKNRAAISIPEWLKEARVEAENYRKSRDLSDGDVFGVAVVKARGKAASEGWAIMRLEDWARLTNSHL